MEWLVGDSETAAVFCIAANDAIDRFCCKRRRLFERDAYRDFLGWLPAARFIESGGLDAVTLTFKGTARSKSERQAEVGRPAWRLSQVLRNRCHRGLELGTTIHYTPKVLHLNDSWKYGLAVAAIPVTTALSVASFRFFETPARKYLSAVTINMRLPRADGIGIRRTP